MIDTLSIAIYVISMTDRQPGVIAAIAAAGSINALARALGIQPSAVSRWEEVPPRRVTEIARRFGIPRHTLRPDLYEAV